VGIRHDSIRNTEHDGYGVKVPLKFFQHDKTVPEAIAKNNLKNDEHDYDAVGPHQNVSDPLDDSIHRIGKSIGWLVGFIGHGDSPFIPNTALTDKY
jgi:hypothetical protein